MMPLSPTRTLLCGPRYALYLNGLNNYVDLPDNTGIRFENGLTIEVLFNTFKAGDGNVYQILSLWSSGPLAVHIHGDGTLELAYCNEAGISKVLYTSTIRPHSWYMLQTSWYPNGSIKAWLNGVLDVTGSLSPPPHPWVDTTRSEIGMYDKAYYFNGYIALARIYSRALSDKEIAWNFNHRDNPVRNGLVMWLHWDSIDIDAGKWYDKTVFGNHGTIYGATLAEPIRLKARILSPVRTLTPLR